jgi:class 3 adenylate cyclase
MAEEGVHRKLTTILAADVAGYSRLMAADEEATHRTLTAYRAIIFDLLKKHQGRLVDTAGDSVLADFGSAVEAVRCAISIQEELAVRNAELPEDQRMLFRIGINVGDVIVEGDDIFGDAVNVAARLESVAAPGSVCISGSTFEQVKNKLSIGFSDIGPQTVKNIPHPVAAFQLTNAPVLTRERGTSNRRHVWVGAIVAIVLAAAGVGAYAVWSNERAAARAEALRLKTEAASKEAAEARRRLEETRRQVAAERMRAAEERRRREEEAKRRAEEEARRRAEEARKRAEAEARRKAEEEARRRTAEEARRKAEEARKRAEAEVRRKAAAAAKRRAAELARRRAAVERRQRAAGSSRNGSQLAFAPGVLSGKRLQSLLVGHTARFRRRHRFKPGHLVFDLTFSHGGELRVACQFHPDRKPARGFPCRADGQSFRWTMSLDQVCWAINRHICFRVVRAGAAYVMRPLPGATNALLRGPFEIIR